MKPDFVVDIGNSRMKWGMGQLAAMEMISLDADNEQEWETQRQKLGTGSVLAAVASVHPQRSNKFAEWLQARGDRVVFVEDRKKLPIVIRMAEPETVGMDRLLGAIAANARRRPSHAAITIDMGTAITVNVVNPDGTFRGGAIFPGYRLMANALNQFTAKLPHIEPEKFQAKLPGGSTDDAIEAGIRCAVLGGITRVCVELAEWMGCANELDVFLTGGSSVPDLLQIPGWPCQHVPTLNLEGIVLAAEALL